MKMIDLSLGMIFVIIMISIKHPMEEPRHQQKVTLLVQRRYILPLLFLADLLFAENLILLSDAKMKLFFSPTAQKKFCLKI